MLHRSTQLPARFTTPLLLGMALTIAPAASADPRACIAAHANGQRQSKAGHLRLAQELFTACGSDESCPKQLRTECVDFLEDVLQLLPTVLFSVLDERKRDVTDVKVFSSDELITQELDGRAIEIDPGKHRLRFVLPSGVELTRDVLIREGDKSRLIEVQVEQPEAHSAPPVLVQPRSVKPTSLSGAMSRDGAPQSGGPPLGAWIATGVSAAAVGTGVTFAVLGAAKSRTIDACSPNCGDDMRPSYDALKRDYLIADIGFVTGLLSAGIATWLFLAPRRVEASRKPQSALLSVQKLASGGMIVPGGGVVVLSGWY